MQEGKTLIICAIEESSLPNIELLLTHKADMETTNGVTTVRLLHLL